MPIQQPGTAGLSWVELDGEDALRNAASLLNVPCCVGAAELRSAFRTAALRCHPDRVAPELQAEAAEAMQQITAAYHTLLQHARTCTGEGSHDA